MNDLPSTSTQIAVERAVAALRADDTQAAVRIATEAVDAGLGAPLLLNLAAYGHEQNYRFQQSLDLLQRAHALAPTDPLILSAIGQSLSQQGRMDAARDAFEAALRLEPTLAPAHYGLGLAIEALGDVELARGCLERAVQFAPDFADPYGSLAVMASTRKDFEQVHLLANLALAIAPAQPAANLALAAYEFESGDLAAAEQRLLPLTDGRPLAPLHLASVWCQLAEIFDATGRWGEAFKAYSTSNTLIRTIYRPHFEGEGAELGVETCARLAAHFRTTNAERWATNFAEPPTSGPARRHIFLVGFPRSGTTLLEQVLASHPEVVTLEERPTLGGMEWDYFKDRDALDRLAGLQANEIETLRQDYWRKVGSFGIEANGKTFVDKMPLNTIWLPLIAKIFPDAGVLLVRRDPRDVVLSCFRRQFQMTSLMYEFTDLTRAALLYDGVMTLAEIYSEILPLAVHIHRHENLIDNFDDETRAICAFMGVPWSEQMREFVETAQSRDVGTPSAPQVLKGLNASGIEQWRNYLDDMAPAMEILDPWAKRYGYRLD